MVSKRRGPKSVAFTLLEEQENMRELEKHASDDFPTSSRWLACFCMKYKSCSNIALILITVGLLFQWTETELHWNENDRLTTICY